MKTTDQIQREAVARAIWAIRREREDRCDMELEDMGDDHDVWLEADATIAALSPALPAPAAPTYRLLEWTDRIQADDEFIDDDTVTWHKPVGWEIGAQYGAAFMPARRKVNPTPLPGTP